MTKIEMIRRKIEARRELLDTQKVATFFDRTFKPEELVYRGRIALTKMLRAHLTPFDVVALWNCKRETILLPQAI